MKMKQGVSYLQELVSFGFSRIEEDSSKSLSRMIWVHITTFV